MKRSIWALGMLGAVLSAVGPGIAVADNCVASSGDGYAKLSANALQRLMNQSMACYPAAGPPWTNQEYQPSNGSGGTITDYKKGPSDPKDPSKAIGTYSVIGTGSGGQITYSYTAGGTFVYTVWGTQSSGSGTYDFCNASLAPLPGRVKIIAQVGASPIAC
jgi:hypothetical protein